MKPSESHERKEKRTPLLISENQYDFTFVSQPYDLDVIRNYFNIEKKFNVGTGLKKGLQDESKQKTFLQDLLQEIREYSNSYEIDLDFHLAFGYGLIIYPKDTYYFNVLALGLASVDLFKMESFLDFQAKDFEKKSDFPNILEFVVFERIKRYNPIKDTGKRKKAIMKWVKKYRNSISGNEEPKFPQNDSPENSISDTRIKCDLSTKEIESYFMKLSNYLAENEMQFMNEKDVLHLLRSNFSGFNPKAEIKKLYVNPQFKGAHLRYFVYVFWNKFAKNSIPKKRFTRFLKENFSLFDDYEDESLHSNLSIYPTTFPKILKKNLHE